MFRLATSSSMYCSRGRLSRYLKQELPEELALLACSASLTKPSPLLMVEKSSSSSEVIRYSKSGFDSLGLLRLTGSDCSPASAVTANDRSASGFCSLERFYIMLLIIFGLMIVQQFSVFTAQLRRLMRRT